MVEFPNELSTFNPQLANLNQEQIQRALRRRAHRLIDRLRHRTENKLFRNVEDLAPVTTDDDETIAVWELTPAPDATPLEALIHKEECAELEKLKTEFIAFLGKDHLLQAVFRCLCEGISKRAAIAHKLIISCNTVKNTQKRLDRQIAEFNGRRSLKKV